MTSLHHKSDAELNKLVQEYQLMLHTEAEEIEAFNEPDHSSHLETNGHCD